MKHEINGDVEHVASNDSVNDFTIHGRYLVDDNLQPDEYILRFGLADDALVAPLRQALRRIVSATAEWKNSETIGVLRLRLIPAECTTDDQSAGENGGGAARELKVRDLIRSLADRSPHTSKCPLPGFLRGLHERNAEIQRSFADLPFPTRDLPDRDR